MGIGEIQEGKEVLCKECGTKSYRDVEVDNGKNNENYGIIVCHKKGCVYVKALLDNSVEV